MTLPRFDMPALEYVTTDTTEIANSIIDAYQDRTGRVLAGGDPIRLFLLTIADVISIMRNDINSAAQQQNLTYAVEGFLDAIGVLLNCTRLPASYAITTFHFTLSAGLVSAYTIPSGTQITNGIVVFATDEDLTIPIGETVGDVSATCTISGTTGNGYAIGSLFQMAQPLPYVASVANTTVTSGGAETETDEAFAQRIHLVTASYSVAGPIGAYEYYTYSVSPAITDVLVTSPIPGRVDVYPLLSGGVLPTQSILDQVLEALSAEDIRPLTDDVHVLSPVEQQYDIDLTYYISRDDQKRGLQIQAAVQAAVADYALWQRSGIGRDLNPDRLTQLVLEAGAKRVNITSPVYTVMPATQIAIVDSTNVVFGGYEEA